MAREGHLKACLSTFLAPAAAMQLSLTPSSCLPARASRRTASTRFAPTASLHGARERVGVALAASALAAALAAPPAFAKAADFGVYWLSPAAGATVTNPVKVKVMVKGLDVKPAGAIATGRAKVQPA